MFLSLCGLRSNEYSVVWYKMKAFPASQPYGTLTFCMTKGYARALGERVSGRTDSPTAQSHLVSSEGPSCGRWYHCHTGCRDLASVRCPLANDIYACIFVFCSYLISKFYNCERPIHIVRYIGSCTVLIAVSMCVCVAWGYHFLLTGKNNF